MSKRIAWCFTVNNYTDENIDSLNKVECRYIIYGKEKGKTGTPHLQGYIELSKRKSLMGVKKLTGINEIHLEARKGTPLQASQYCMKEGDFLERGNSKTQGVRTDWVEIYDLIKEGKTDLEIQDVYPGQYMHAYKGIQKIRSNILEDVQLSSVKAIYAEAELRTWQQDCITRLLSQDSRKVLWYYDKVGNTGKSYLAKYLFVKHTAFLVMNGKSADISYAYDSQSLVVFDFARTLEEYVNYQVIESFKNGVLFSPKYESKVKIFQPARVVVFANFLPDTSKLSADRWDIVCMD